MSCCGGKRPFSIGPIILKDKSEEYIVSLFKKRFVVSDNTGLQSKMMFEKGDEYAKSSFSEDTYKMLTEYKVFGTSAFKLIKANTKKVEVKKEEPKTLDERKAEAEKNKVKSNKKK